MAEREQGGESRPSFSDARATLRTHPRQREGWHVVPGALPWQSGWSVIAVDATGGVFGFGVQAGWPEMAEKLARALECVLADLDADV